MPGECPQSSVCPAIAVDHQHHAICSMQPHRSLHLSQSEVAIGFFGRRGEYFRPSGDLERVGPPDSALLEEFARYQLEPRIEARDDACVRAITIGLRVEMKDLLQGFSRRGAP